VDTLQNIEQNVHTEVLKRLPENGFESSRMAGVPVERELHHALPNQADDAVVRRKLLVG